ncbi:MAG: VOC family protein [Acidobacteriia bacterium]|nr:VOC family protein [Terriglobia bacterium]
MKRVTGIGGIFIKAKDPQAMYAWYETHLGIQRDTTSHTVDFACKDNDTGEEAHTYWSLFKENTNYFDPSKSAVMINYRVADMDAVVSALQSGGIEILGREDHDYGRFAWVMDPEGNKIELWEPPKKQ